MKSGMLLLVLAIAGCSTATLPVRPPDNIAQSAVLLQPQRPISELLNVRLYLCAQNPALRAEALAGEKAYWQQYARPGDPTWVDEDKLNALLVASCQPALTPGVLRQLLAELTAAGTWPEDYAAFFDLLIAGHKAYASVEKLYFDLSKDHAALKKEHERTIKGLGEIETEIEEQRLE
jgi:hypothetical protein